MKPNDNLILPLVSLSAGQQARVESLAGGRSLVNRLAVLGFIPGQEVTVVHNFGHGPIIVSICGTRVALGRGEAHSITVRRTSELEGTADAACPKASSIA